MNDGCLILCLETCSKICSVALGQKGKILSLKESAGENYSHSETLTLLIEKAVRAAKISINDLSAVAVSKGPGSFTGLRIGVSTAKGLCYALNKPLIAINSLEAMAVAAISNLPLAVPHLLCPMLDAKRMEVYCAVYDKKLNEVKKTSAEIIDRNSFAGLLEKNKIIFFGEGAAKCKSLLVHPNAVFPEGPSPSAKNMLPLAEKYFRQNRFENLACFEPFYLKDFVGVKSRGLNL